MWRTGIIANRNLLSERAVSRQCLVPEGQAARKIVGVPCGSLTPERPVHPHFAAANPRDRGEHAGKPCRVRLDVGFSGVHQERFDFCGRTIWVSLDQQRRGTGDHRRRARGPTKRGRAVTRSHLGGNRRARRAEVWFDRVKAVTRSTGRTRHRAANQWNEHVRRNRNVHGLAGRKLRLDSVSVRFGDHQRVHKRVPTAKGERNWISSRDQSDQHADGAGLGRPVHLETHVASAPVNQGDVTGGVCEIGIPFAAASHIDEVASEPIDDRCPTDVFVVGILPGNHRR